MYRILKKEWSCRIETLVSRQLMAADVGNIVDHVEVSTSLVTSQATQDVGFLRDQLRRSIETGVDGNRFSFATESGMLVVHQDTLTHFVKVAANEWQSQGSITFDTDFVSIEPFQDKFLAVTADSIGLDNTQYRDNHIISVSTSNELVIEDSFTVPDGMDESRPAEFLIAERDRRAVPGDRGVGNPSGIVLGEGDAFNEKNILFGDRDGFASQILVRSSNPLSGPISDDGFALLSPSNGSGEVFYLVAANETVGELLATVTPLDGMGQPTQLISLGNDRFEITASFMGENNQRFAGRVEVNSNGHFVTSPEALSDAEANDLTTELANRAVTSNATAGVNVVNIAEGVRIWTDSYDQSVIVPADGVRWGTGISGRGGVYVTDDESVLALRATIDVGDVDPVDLANPQTVNFPTTAILLQRNLDGQYEIVDSVPLGDHGIGTYSEFSPTGVLTLRRPDGVVTAVEIRGDSLAAAKSTVSSATSAIALGGRLVLLNDDGVVERSLDWTNPALSPKGIFQSRDVNGDGNVSALDALVVINALNRQDASGEMPSSDSMTRDVNGDGQVSALDALLVINYLNSADIDSVFASDVNDDDDELTTRVREPTPTLF